MPGLSRNQYLNYPNQTDIKQYNVNDYEEVPQYENDTSLQNASFDGVEQLRYYSVIGVCLYFRD